MAAANTDKFMYMGSPGTATTLSAPGYTVGNTSINVGSTTNWDTTSGVCFSIYETEVVGNETVMVDGTYNEYFGVVSTGTSVTSVTHVAGSGTDRNYSAGPLTVVTILFSSGRENRLIDGILTHADQDGTLKAGAVDNAAVLASDVVTTAKILDSNVAASKVASGFAVQVVSANFNAVATGTTTIPSDDTIPQNTEGDQYMTLAFTPKSATNTLVIEVVGVFSSTAAQEFVVALFQDSTANAIAATSHFFSLPGVNLLHTMPLTHSQVSGTTSTITFKVRAGGGNAGTTTFNGVSGTRRFGAITKSSITITEYKA